MCTVFHTELHQGNDAAWPSDLSGTSPTRISFAPLFLLWYGGDLMFEAIFTNVIGGIIAYILCEGAKALRRKLR